MDVIVDNIQKIPLETLHTRRKKNNLCKEEWVALNQLKNNDQLIIKEADKGRSIVVMSTTYYKSRMETMLSDEMTYTKIQEKQDKIIINNLKTLLQSTDANLLQAEIKYLTDFEYRTSQFYGLPKTHKCTSITQQRIDPEGYLHVPDPQDLQFRPIVAGPASPTHRLSNLLDLLLKPLLRYIKSYLRDDMDFLNKLAREVPEQSILVTLDVVSLYSKIPHQLGLEALKYWTSKYPNDIHQRFTQDFIMTGAKYILENNTFEFNEIHFRQISGTAMGTNFAPTYANLTMGYLEKTILHEQLLMNFGQDKTYVIEDTFLRYLDDCWITWPFSTNELDRFVNILNQMHESISFTCDRSVEKLPFLDVMVFKKSTCLVTDLFIKPTDSRRFLPFHSNHPRHTKVNIPYNLARRIRMITDDPVAEENHYHQLMLDLEKQGYPSSLVEKGINRAKRFTKQQLRTPATSKQQANDMPMVSTYNPNNPDIMSYIRLNYGILQNDPETRDIFQGTSIINAKRQSKNLGKYLCKARFTAGEDVGVYKCLRPRCLLCKYLITGPNLILECGTNFHVKARLTCDSTNVLYLLRCANCSKDYIGETNNLRLRINLHRNHIRDPTHRILPMSRHIATCSAGRDPPFKVFPLYKHIGSDQERLIKESNFIRKYRPSLNNMTVY